MIERREKWDVLWGEFIIKKKMGDDRLRYLVGLNDETKFFLENLNITSTRWDNKYYNCRVHFSWGKNAYQLRGRFSDDFMVFKVISFPFWHFFESEMEEIIVKEYFEEYIEMDLINDLDIMVKTYPNLTRTYPHY